MPEYDKDELKEIVKEAVAEMQLQPSEQGVTTQEMIENHIWIKQQRERSAKLSTAFFVLIMSTFTTGIIAAIWQGIKYFITKQP